MEADTGSAVSLISEDTQKKSLEAVLRKHEEVFSSEPGIMKEFEAKLTVRPGTKQRFRSSTPSAICLAGNC